jgi:hypothetical protein
MITPPVPSILHELAAPLTRKRTYLRCRVIGYTEMCFQTSEVGRPNLTASKCTFVVLVTNVLFIPLALRVRRNDRHPAKSVFERLTPYAGIRRRK